MQPTDARMSPHAIPPVGSSFSNNIRDRGGGIINLRMGKGKLERVQIV